MRCLSKPRVLLDTNIIVSGLVFKGGNEYHLLRLAAEGRFVLVLPEFVVWESERILRTRFGGFEALFSLFVDKVPYVEKVSFDSLDDLVDEYSGVLRDEDDLPILVSVVQVCPDFVVTGDLGLREDLNNYMGSKVALSSLQLLDLLGSGDQS